MCLHRIGLSEAQGREYELLAERLSPRDQIQVRFEMTELTRLTELNLKMTELNVSLNLSI